MTKFLIAFLLFSLPHTVNAQADTSLAGRLQAFIKVNNDMNYEGIMNFTYPKVFEIAPRELLLEEIKNTFENDEVNVKMDSMRVDTIFPVFTLGEGSFAKIKYSFLMIMHFPQEDDPDDEEEKLESVMAGMQEQYGEENVKIQDGAIIISVKSEMAAVKDKYATDWCFMDILNNKDLNELMLDEEVLKKLNTYQ